MLDAPDSVLFATVCDENWVLVTNNSVDFVQLARDARLHPGLIAIPQLRVVDQRRCFHDVITYIENEASIASEAPADWMVGRLVAYDDRGSEIYWEWIPDPPL